MKLDVIAPKPQLAAVIAALTLTNLKSQEVYFKVPWVKYA